MNADGRSDYVVAHMRTKYPPGSANARKILRALEEGHPLDNVIQDATGLARMNHNDANYLAWLMAPAAAVQEERVDKGLAVYHVTERTDPPLNAGECWFLLHLAWHHTKIRPYLERSLLKGARRSRKEKEVML